MITNKMDHEPTNSNLSQLFNMQQSSCSSSSDSNRSCSSSTSSLCSSPTPISPSDHHRQNQNNNDSSCFSSLMMHYHHHQSEPIFIKNEKTGSTSSSSQVNMLLSSSSSSSTASTSPSKMIICCEEDRAMTDMTSPFACNSSRGSDHHQSANDRTNMSQTTEDYLDYSSVSADDEDYDDMDIGSSQLQRRQQQSQQQQTGSGLNNSSTSDLNNNNCLNDLPMSGSIANNASSNSGSNSSSRANRFFPDWVVEILNRWFNENLNFPYPDEHMTNVLAKEASISPKQVRKWFANKRVRSNKCYKQTFRKKDGSRMSRKETKSISDLDMLSYSPAAVGQEKYYPAHSSSSSSGSEDVDHQHHQYDDRLGHSGLKKSISVVGAWPLDNPSTTSSNDNNKSTSKQSLSSSVSSSCSSYIYRNEKKMNCSDEPSIRSPAIPSTNNNQQMSSPNGTTNIQAYLNLFSNLVQMNNNVKTSEIYPPHHHHRPNDTNNNRSNSSCSINSACLTCSSNQNSNENKSESALATASSYLASAAAAASIYNPLIYLAFLSQNPAANLATAAATLQQPPFPQVDRDDSVFESQSSTISKENEPELYRKNLESQLKSSPPSSLKRKTHLSNIFMNDMSQQTSRNVCNEESSSKLAQILRPDTSLEKPQLPLPQPAGLIESLLVYPQQHNILSHNTVPKRKTKVNFGDISDLIN